MYKRHLECRDYCIKRLHEMGLELYVHDDDARSPTTTACCIPQGTEWKVLDKKLRDKNVVLGGTFGDVEGKLFRIGHMGIQADMNLLKAALDTLEEVLRN